MRSQRNKAQGFIKAGAALTIIVSPLISLLVVDRSLHLAFAIPPLLMLIMLGLSWTAAHQNLCSGTSASTVAVGRRTGRPLHHSSGVGPLNSPSGAWRLPALRTQSAPAV
ncbi:hypothetical protein [Streptomyces sp. NPDC047974]|uniref:hypothetical protein n=1 Tax=Streptomyces sp. NPDC047974 TaxID=3154343 RepID=UPI0033D16DCD